MKFVYGLGCDVEAVHLIATGSVIKKVFSPIEGMFDTSGHLVGLLPFQPLVGFERLTTSFAIPSAGGFQGQRLGGQMVFAVIPHASRGDGDAFGHGVEIGLGGKFSLKDFATGFQDVDVGSTVGDHFLAQIELEVLHGWVPRVKGFSHVGFHAVRVVILGLGPRPHVLLMGLGVEEMRKEAFFGFREIEGGGKGGEAKGEKT